MSNAQGTIKAWECERKALVWTLILRAPLRVQNRQQREGESVNNQYKLKGMLCFFIVYLSP